MENPKPCPCGGKPVIWVTMGEWPRLYSVECEDCYWSTKQFWSRRRAVRYWNRREE